MLNCQQKTKPRFELLLSNSHIRNTQRIGNIRIRSQSPKRLALRIGGWWFGRYVSVGGGLVVTYWWVVVCSLHIGG